MTGNFQQTRTDVRTGTAHARRNIAGTESPAAAAAHCRQDIASSALEPEKLGREKDTFRLSDFQRKIEPEKMSAVRDAERESDSESRQRTTKRRRDLEIFLLSSLPPFTSWMIGGAEGSQSETTIINLVSGLGGTPK